MKKVLLLALGVAAISFASCKKEEVCNCGTISDQKKVGADFVLTYKNECSQNEKTEIVPFDQWIDAKVGQEHCEDKGW